MAGNRVQYTIGFNADTSQAKKALQELNSQLDKLKANAESDLGISSDLTEAAKAAELLQQNLAKAFNQSTGRFNFSDLNKSLQNSGTSVTELSRKFLNCGATGQSAFLALSRAISTMEIPMTKASTALDKMMQTLKNTVKWELSSNLVHGLESAFSGAIGYVKDLNSSLNDIRIVTGYSADDMAKFAQSANKAAKELSTTTKAYTDASLIYFQQGDSAETVAKKAAITTKAANVAFSASAEEMSEMLTAVWNSYQVGEDELERYVDIMAALGAATASSTEEIATAMQKVAATANTVGVSMEQMSSIIATVASVTREAPESIGTSFKTILARIGDLKVGKTLEDGVSLGTVSSQLKAVGVDILDTTGNLRDMGAVLEELMGKWQSMTSAEKTAIAQAVGGKRQYTQLMALMENQDMYQKSMNIAGNADGTLQEQADIYAESWEAASKKVKTSLEGIYQNLIPEKGLISATKSLSKILDFVNEMIDGLGGLQGIIIQVGSALATAFSSNIAASISNMVSKVSGFVKSFDMIGSDGKKLGFKDKVKSLFTETTDQRKYKNDNIKLQQQIAEANDNPAISNSTKQQLNMSQTLLNKRLELLAVEKNMSAEQKAVAEEYLNNLSKQAEKIGELKQEQIDYNSQLERQKRSVKELGDLQAIHQMDDGTVDGAVKKAKSSDELMRAREIAAQSLMAPRGSYNGKNSLQDIAHNELFNGKIFDESQFSGATKNLDGLIDRFVKLEGAAQNIAHVRAAFEQFVKIDTGEAEDGIKNLGEQLQTLKDSLAEKGMNTSGIDNLIEKFNKLSDEEKKQPGALKEIIDELARLQDTASSGVSQAITFMSDKLGIPKEKLIELRDSADLTEDQIIALANAMRTLGAESGRSFEVSSFQKNAKKVIQAISGMTSAWSSFSNLVANWDDSSFTSKATGILSTVTNIAGRFLSGDIVGGIGATIGAGIGLVTGIIEKNKKEEQQKAEEISNTVKNAENKNNDLQAENSDAKNLLKTYNQLYEQYLAGEDVQDQLAESAKALGEAYGITGAAIAKMTGNYESFNEQIEKTLKFSDLIEKDNNFIAEQEKNWNNFSNNDLLGVQSSSNRRIRVNADEVEPSSVEFYPSNYETSPWDLFIKQYSEYSGQEEDAARTIAENSFSAMYPGQSSLYKMTYAGLQNYIISNGSVPQLKMDVDNWKQYISTLDEDAKKYVDGAMAVAHLQTSLMNSNGELIKFALASDGSYGVFDSLAINDNQAARAMDMTTFLQKRIFAQEDDKYSKYLYDGTVYWDQNSSLDTAYHAFQDYQDWRIQLQDEQKKLEDQISKGTDEQGNSLSDDEIEKLKLQKETNENILSQISEIVDNVDYQTLFENYGQALRRQASNRAIVDNFKTFIGKNEYNTSFDDYLQNFSDIESVVMRNSDAYEELNGLNPEKDAEEYNNAVRSIVTRLLNDYSSFDDYTSIYTALTDYFEGENLDTALSYIKNQGIKSASDIDATLLWAMQRAMNNGVQDLSEDDLVVAALKANQDRTAANDSKAHYEKMKSSSETLKKDMSLDDATKLYSAYWDGSVENIMAWEDFVKLDYEEREAYLSSIIDKSLDTTKEEYKTAVESAQQLKDIWQETFNNQYGGNIDNWNTASDAYAIFKSKIMSNYQLQEDGSYLFIGQDKANDKYSEYLNGENGSVQSAFSYFLSNENDYSSISNDDSGTYSVENIQAFDEAVQKGKTLDNDLLATTAFLNGLDAVGKGPQSPSEIINRTTESIHTLNQELSEFAKTGKLSAKAMQAFRENGINPKDITTTKTYLDNMLKILNIQRDAVNEQKTNYATKNNGIAYNPNKIWTQEEIDKDPALYEAWIQIGQAEMDVKDLQDEIFSTMASRGAEVLSELEARTNKIKEDAEKFGDAADVMASAIETGELSFSDQQILEQVGYLEAWNETTNAIERATLANKAFSEYAAKNAIAGQEMATVYKNAEQTLDGLSKSSQLWSNSQHLMRSLTGNEYKMQTKEGFIGILSDLFEIDDKEIHGAVSKAWDILQQNGFDFEKATNAEITQAIMDQLNEMGVDADNAWKQILASAKDSILGVYSSLGEKEQELAQSVVDTWESAFNKIAALRSKILMGESIGEDLTSSFDTFLMYASQYNGTPEEMIKAYKSGAIKADSFNYGSPSDYAEALKNSKGLQYFSFEDSDFNLGKISKDFSISSKDFDTTEEYMITLRKTLTGYLQNLLNGEDILTLSKGKFKNADDLINAYVNNNNADALGIISSLMSQVNEVAKPYAELAESEQKILEAQNERDRIMQQNQKEVEKATTNVTGANSALSYNRGEATITEALSSSNVDLYSFAKRANEILGRNDLTAKNLDVLTDDELRAITSAETAAAEKFHVIIVNAAEQFAAKFTGNGEFSSYAGSTYNTEAQDTATEANDASASFKQNAIDIEQIATEMATSVGMSKQEFTDFAESLYYASGAIEDFNDLAPELKREMLEVARKTKNAEDGFKSLQETSKDTWKILKKETTSSAGDYSKVLTGMKQNMAKIFNTDMSKISNKFVEDHLEQMQKMAEGTKEEAMAAQDAIENDLVAELLKADGIESTVTINIDGVDKTIDILDMFQNQFDQWDGQEVGFTVDADTAPAINNMNDLLAAGTMTADQITAALNSIGWEPDITWQDVTMVNEDEEQGTVTVRDSNGNTYTVSSKNIMRTENGLKIPIIGSARKISTPGGGERKKSSGGGGGGGKAKKIDKKDPEDEKDRYHHVNKVLERLSDQLDEIDKKKARVYGKGYLDYLDQEIALTEKQCDAYQRYIDEAKEYLALDTERVASLGAMFDEFGNIENYDEVMDNIIGKYNEFVDRYNAMSAAEQEAAEEEKTQWDEWYDEKKKWIENYEDTVSTIYEQQNNLLEAQNKISEKILEGIQYKIEIHVDITDGEKDFLEYLNDKYDELLEKQGEVMNNLVRETELAVSNLEALGQAKEELDAAFASGKLNQADYVDGLKDVNDQILENLGNIQDLKKEIEELYGNVLDMASEAFDEQTDKVKSASEAMSSYISILGLIGKGSNLKDLTKFYESQYEYNLQSLEMQKEYLDILRSEEQYYLERMNSAEGLTETERQQYEDLEKTIAEVNSNILSDTESTLNQIVEAFNNEIEIIFEDLEERIAGVGNSVQDLADAYQYYQEEQSRYVTSARELYEVNKLNRQIEKTMNETSSKVNKNLLAALQERINKQSELNELTEYDIEMNQLQYELLLKKIALEEAQNAKSTVRLTRDSGGNYVYQYTADQDEIAQKQQEYEDVLQQINDLSVNRVQDLESQLLEIYQNTLSKIKEIAQDQTLTEEEKYDKIQTIMNQFKEQTNFIQEQYQIASDNLITSNLAISEHYGKQLVEHSENAKNGLNQTIAAMIEDTEGLQQALEDACANKIPAAMDTMQSRIDAVTAAVNLDYNTMSESVDTYNKVTKDAQDQTNKTANTLSKDLLPAIHSATTAWDSYMSKLKSVISTYEEMYKSILKTIEAQAKLSNATAPSTIDNTSKGDGKFTDKTPTGGNQTPTGGGAGGGGSKTSSVKAKPKYTVEIDGMGRITVEADSPQQAAKKTGAKASYQYGYSVYDSNGKLVLRVNALEKPKSGGGGGGSFSQIAYKYATGGLADFTGPAWLDGTRAKPEIVLNPEDTQNLLTAVQGVRALDASTLSMLNKYITNASLAMSFGLGNISAGSVYGTTDTIQQEVHITAEFPNATNSAEIQDAFDNIINRATQYITTKR